LFLDDIELLDTEHPSANVFLPGYIKNEQGLAVLMLTSGSTGNSKAVSLTHGQILVSVNGKSIHHSTTNRDIFLNWIGLDHVANLIEIHLHAASLAAQQVHIQSSIILANPILFLKMLSVHQVTYTFAPNFFLAMLVQTLNSYNKRTIQRNEKHFPSSTLGVLDRNNDLSK
jgi:acyl-CoA synthetase (AMP-forming)/AMP-acid ligase II